jgi:hypothetical protein
MSIQSTGPLHAIHGCLMCSSRPQIHEGLLLQGRSIYTGRARGIRHSRFHSHVCATPLKAELKCGVRSVALSCGTYLLHLRHQFSSLAGTYLPQLQHAAPGCLGEGSSKSTPSQTSRQHSSPPRHQFSPHLLLPFGSRYFT